MKMQTAWERAVESGWGHIATWLVAVFLTTLPLTAQTSQVILEDNFNGTSLASNLWATGTWNLGSRTRLGNQPVFNTEGTNQFITLVLSTYDPANPGSKLLGTEIYSQDSVSRSAGLEMEARVRVRATSGGIICSFFTYGEVNGYSDEIDYEYLTSHPADTILASSWNDWHWSSTSYNDGIHNSSEELTVPGLDRSQWNVLKIRWLTTRTEWWINDVLVRTSSEALANDPMKVRANMWAAGSTWTDAYDETLQPVASAALNTSYYYDIDYIKVTQLNTSPPPEVPPSAPLNLNANVAATTINLSWQDTSNVETGFQIFRALKPKNGAPSFSLRTTVGTNVSSYSESPGKGVWLYKVRAVNNAGASADSNTVQARVR